MSILNKLAVATGNRNEEPNIALAREIARTKDKASVKELIEHLSAKNAAVRSDCIKTLYELGTLEPKLIVPYEKDFLFLLDSKDNRMQWGAMAALAAIAKEDPNRIYEHLPKIIATADKGSVITRDNAVRILIAVGKTKKFADDAFTLLIEQLKSCPENQLPMYAELAMEIVNDENKAVFIKILQSRLPLETESKQKRVEKVIKKLK
ncbi:MAG: hypothetical protein JST82_16395 [Bacteroidetes bacterium]|nr:hypothetical protein [Bacteroidota bacterium]